MDRKPLEQLKAVGKYDPRKDYQWNADDLFTVTGAEIDLWNKALASYVNTPEFQKFAVMQRAAIAMSDFIKQSVEQDLIKEVKSQSNGATKTLPEDGSTLEVVG